MAAGTVPVYSTTTPILVDVRVGVVRGNYSRPPRGRHFLIRYVSRTLGVVDASHIGGYLPRAQVPLFSLLRSDSEEQWRLDMERFPCNKDNHHR